MIVAVVGVGLIGGSIGLAARRGSARTCAGSDPDAARRCARGALDEACADLPEALAGADAAFVAVPVDALPRRSTRVLAAAPGRCVVTDVGSTKRAVVAGAATTSASSAATRWPAPRRPASSTRARTCSTARPGT